MPPRDSGSRFLGFWLGFKNLLRACGAHLQGGACLVRVERAGHQHRHRERQAGGHPLPFRGEREVIVTQTAIRRERDRLPLARVKNGCALQMSGVVTRSVSSEQDTGTVTERAGLVVTPCHSEERQQSQKSISLEGSGFQKSTTVHMHGLKTD